MISSRIGKQKPVLLLSGAAMGLSTALLGFVLSGPLLWPVVCVLGWFTHFRLGPFFAACSLLPEVGAEKVGTMVGLIMLLSSVGGFFSPIIMGLLRNSTGTHIAGLFVVAGFAIPSVLHGVFGQEAIVKA
ncbi:MAG: MFS transporter [Crenarchaeota archaeon]|nr:MFS transporter [Thermoproteota archaeon]